MIELSNFNSSCLSDIPEVTLSSSSSEWVGIAALFSSLLSNSLPSLSSRPLSKESESFVVSSRLYVFVLYLIAIRGFEFFS